ncbi:unnamed protein product [Aphanomyces euteiches]
MKAEAVALTEEERQYREALQDVDDVKIAREDVKIVRENLQKANQKLKDWEVKPSNKDDEYQKLKQDVKDAEQRLQIMEQDRNYADQMLQNAWERWKDARAMLEKANQSIAVANEVERDSNRKRKAADSHCEAKKSCLDRERESAEHLMSAIRGCKVDRIFDVESILELPFPSLLAPTNRFHLKKGAFKYQARSDLKPLYDKIVRLWKEGRPITVNVAGTSGYGKSHILVALVLLLLKYPIESKGGWTPFVCYIPDSRQLLGTEIDVMKILHRNILLNVPNYTLQLVTIKDVWAFMQNKRVILVADHWNPINKNNPKCAMARERTPHALLPKPTTQENNVCYGGLKDDEFAVWLEHHPNIFTENKDELALLTSKVPLLLTAFARVYQVGDSWERVVQRVQQDTIVKDIFTLLKFFYANIDSNLDIVDFRFFYEDSLRGFCATSKIVQRLVYRVRTAKTAGHVLLKQWRGLVSNSPNRSTLGLDVEAIIKAKVCQRGIKGLS